MFTNVALFLFHRFDLLKRIIRFDDKSTRQAHLDRFAAFRNVFTKFDLNCQKHWELSAEVTIDETLRRFFGRSSFRVYMPQKPGKYGLLSRVMSDAEFRYIYKTIPYAGVPPGVTPEEQAAHKARNTPYSVVLQLTEDIAGSGRNVTTDR